MSAFDLSNNPEQSRLVAMASAYRGGSATLARIFDRGTAAGETSHREEQMRLRYRKETAGAERELAAATAERVARASEASRIEAKTNTLMKERSRIEKALAEGGSGPERQKLHERFKNLNEEITGLSSQGEQAQNSLVQSSRIEARARSGLNLSRVRESKLAEADVLESRAQSSAGRAYSLGRMNPMQRQMGLAVLEQLRSGVNPDAIPEHFLSAAEAFAPDEVRKILENHGAGTAEFKEAKRQGVAGYYGRPAELQKQADQLRQDYGQQEYDIESRSAKEVAAAGAELGTSIRKLVEIELRAATKAIEDKMRESRN